MRQRNVIVTLVGLVLLAPALALGQVTTALLQRRVLDQAGAVIPGASVEARNLDTTKSRPAIGLGGTYRSEAPYNITTGLDDNGDGNFNDCPPGVEGNSGRGPEAWTVNLRLARVFSVKGMDLELIAETFNVFDQTNETNFIGNLPSPAFGQPTAVQGGAFGPRQTQLGLRIDF